MSLSQALEHNLIWMWDSSLWQWGGRQDRRVSADTATGDQRLYNVLHQTEQENVMIGNKEEARPGEGSKRDHWGEGRAWLLGQRDQHDHLTGQMVEQSRVLRLTIG